MIIEFAKGIFNSFFSMLGPIIVWPCIFLLIKGAVAEGLEEAGKYDVKSVKKDEAERGSDDTQVEPQAEPDKKTRGFKGTSLVPIIFLILYTYYILGVIVYR